MKNIGISNIGKKLKKLRSSVYMEQEIVAKVLGVPRTAISAIENGQREISVTELMTFCKLFRISPNEILGWGSVPVEASGE